ncbi:MAG: iron ABC transporter permease [Hydrogenophaga sp.]|uniref:FecCD family ABC transporter permease n=1 Tax=Hydrogenophaga sp. TaxID=1904254 RepID=UPI002630B5AB|nr:iron ABC transporter permease [Hydrogenophaga sp.]MDM7941400.1 iron ABC transporter permease [Hydrogenophaga sp.]
MSQVWTRQRAAPWVLIITALMFLATAVIAIGTGAVAIAPGKVVAILLGQAHPDITDAQRVVVLNVRLPRVLLALLAGAGLACAGVMMQALFRNPLADPALIGVSAGAALGAVSVIVLGATVLHGLALVLGVWTLPVAAFLGALATATLVFRLSQRDGVLDATTMLLCGIAINALTGAGIGLLTYLATDEQLRNLTFWSLGSMGGATWSSLLGAAPAIVLMVLVGPWLAHQLNALLLGESEALHLGVAVESLKRTVIALTAASAGAVVAVSGVIGFVGLVAPHMARLLVGPDHRLVLPLASLLGAMVLTAGDMVARTAVRPAELPIGILTAFIGAPFFLWLLRRRQGTEEARP